MTPWPIALTVILTCSSGVAWAQANLSVPRSLSEQESEADTKFHEGKAKAREQKWDEALQLFERSWQLKPSYDSAGNLGQVALKLGLYTKAATYLDRCLHLFPASGSKTQRAQIEGLFREAAAHVAVVHFTVGSEAGELVLDRTTELGPARGPLGAVYVNPGTHIIQLRQGSQILAEQSFLAVASASQRVQISISQDYDTNPGGAIETGNSTPSHTPQPFDSGNREPQSRSILPIIVGASIATASVITAGVLLNGGKNQVKDAQALQTQLQERQPGTQACLNGANAAVCNHLRDMLLSADRRYNWSYAMFGVGGASLLATLTYALWPVFSSQPAERRVQNGQYPAVEFQAGEGTAMLSYRARF